MPTPPLDLAEAVDDDLKTSLSELNELSDRDMLDQPMGALLGELILP